MTKLIVDGKEVDVPPEYTLLQACEAAGAEIPRFCFHERLSIAGNCRMCLIEVVGGPPKPQASCAMGVKDLPPNKDGTPRILSTKSPMVRKAREGVMEFLLINHPLDCPICDQGGECDLQDQAMAYGVDSSRYKENKRAVEDKYIGPLVKTIMTRCIQCTRCIRFTEEIAGVQELGMIGRGEQMKVRSYIETTVHHEMSGNVIDLCPVGALVSKPYRFSARAWEMTSHPLVSPHDGVGTNLFGHVLRGKLMRVVPRENEAINEVWIADRDRFSYEGVYSRDRLQRPLIRKGDEWLETDWETALGKAALGLQPRAAALGVLASPCSTLEELYLAGRIARGLGTNNIDHRLRQRDVRDQSADPVFPSLGMSLAAIDALSALLVVGSNLRR
ncbi:MAG: NADH-quinone oxidoreductase subunit NuoG, partial [Candidatus Binataceae bacterium]